MSDQSKKLPRWFRGLAALGAIVSLLAAVFVVWNAGLPSEDDDPIGPVRPFTVQTLDGQTLTVDASLNRPLIINFWATWCVPCAVEMPRLEQVYAQYAERGLLVLGVNAAQEDPRDAEAYAITHDLSFPLVIDFDRSIERSYEVRGVLPTTVFVDADGQIQEIIYGILTEDSLESGLHRIGIAQ